MEENFTTPPPPPPHVDPAFTDPAQSAAPGVTATKITDQEAWQWAMYCHLAALLGIPFPTVGHVIGPVIVWLLKKDSHPFIDDQGKEAINFQISMTLYLIVAAFSAIALIGFVLFPLVYVADIVLTIMGGMAASRGEPYRYPLTLRFIR